MNKAHFSTSKPNLCLTASLMLHQLADISLRQHVRVLTALECSSENIFSCDADFFAQWKLSTQLKTAVENFKNNQSSQVLEHIEKQYSWMHQQNIKLYHYGDENYPQLLTYIPQPPPYLYLKGDADLLHHAQVAIVGSRKASSTGKQVANELAVELAQNNFVVTSGMAAGIDAAAHRAVLGVNKPTIAVLGTGIDRVYPKYHQDLAAEIMHTGLLVSEFCLGQPPRREHFPQRNRIISGLSLGTVVVEAGEKSGSLITADFALEQGRDVFAVPGSLANPQSVGCHALIKQGATFTQTAQDILDNINLNLLDSLEMHNLIPANTKTMQKKISQQSLRPVINTEKSEIGSSENELLNAIDDGGSSLEEIQNQLAWDFLQLSKYLLALEQQGLISQQFGFYKKI